MTTDITLYEEEFQRLSEILRRMHQDSNARAVLLIDANGQLIASAGDTEQYDMISLASLIARNLTASDDLDKLIRELEFSALHHEGQREHIHISIVAKRAILVVIFDERSSLGLVRLRVKRAIGDLEDIFNAIVLKSGGTDTTHGSPFPELTNKRINTLFGE